jgi:hypothetical protein
MLCTTTFAQDTERDDSRLIRIRATPGKRTRTADPQVKPLVPQASPTASASAAPADSGDFLARFDHLFGPAGKLRPTPTPVPVAEDSKTTAQRVAEMIREIRPNLPPNTITATPNWVRNATPTPPGSYVAPTPKPVVRVATPPPKSSLPSIDLGGSTPPDY